MKLKTDISEIANNYYKLIGENTCNKGLLKELLNQVESCDKLTEKEITGITRAIKYELFACNNDGWHYSFGADGKWNKTINKQLAILNFMPGMNVPHGNLYCATYNGKGLWIIDDNWKSAAKQLEKKIEEGWC